MTMQHRMSRGDEPGEYPANPSLTCREIKTTVARSPRGNPARVCVCVCVCVFVGDD